MKFIVKITILPLFHALININKIILIFYRISGSTDSEKNFSSQICFIVYLMEINEFRGGQ